MSMQEYNKRNSAKFFDSLDMQNQIEDEKNNPVIQVERSITNHVKSFEDSLNEDEDVMVLAASFGGMITFYVQNIEFNRPNIIVFHGTTDDGRPTRLIQHYNQLNFLLQAVPRSKPEENRNPIGFLSN